MNDTPPTLYCANHPRVETSLRCNNCEKPICPKCAVLTPTGYRCKECVRGQQTVFNTALWYDYPVIFFLVGTLTYLGSLLATRIGFFILFVAPIIGIGVAEAARFATGRRRSRLLYQVAGIAAILGSLPPFLMLILAALAGYSGIGMFWNLLWQGYYAFTVFSTVYYRLRGVRIG